MKKQKVVVSQIKMIPGMRVPSPKTDPKFLKNASEALNYCLMECRDFKDGCAVDCKIRKHFKIPPHGDKYPGD